MSDPRNPDGGSQKSSGGTKQPRDKSRGSSNPFGGAPPKYTPPVHGAENQYLVWAKAHGYDRQTAGDIWYWAHAKGIGIDPYYFSAVLLAESGGKHIDPATGQVKSSGQAVGIGQIATSKVGHPIPWDPTRNFTYDNDPRTGILNYGVNLREAATVLATGVKQNGYAGAYLKTYNPSDPHNVDAWKNIQSILKTRPAGLAPLAPSQGPADASSKVGATPYATFKDPYVAGVDSKGKLVTTNDPARAYKHLSYDGLPLTRSQFKSLQDSLSSLYVSYTGARPSSKQIANYLQKGWSTYQLVTLLSQSPNFKNSPIYKENAPQLNAALKDLLPKGQTIPPELMRKAILNKWDGTTVAAKLRQLPGYVNTNEFKGNVAALIAMHTSVMGTPDQQSMVAIKDAALQGWTAPQYAAWLRTQPGYDTSIERQKSMMGFMSVLGLIGGQQPTLTPSTLPPNLGTTGLPSDKRDPGQVTVGTGTSGLVGGLASNG